MEQYDTTGWRKAGETVLGEDNQGRNFEEELGTMISQANPKDVVQFLQRAEVIEIFNNNGQDVPSDIASFGMDNCSYDEDFRKELAYAGYQFLPGFGGEKRYDLVIENLMMHLSDEQVEEFLQADPVIEWFQDHQFDVPEDKQDIAIANGQWPDEAQEEFLAFFKE